MSGDGRSDDQRGDETSADQPVDQPVEHGTFETVADDEVAADAVRSALNRAREAARQRGLIPGTPSGRLGRGLGGVGPGSGRGRRRVGDPSVHSGAHPDGRDPQPMALSVDKLVVERGWQAPVAVGGVMGRWDAVVGSEIAAHCTPETFTDGVLTVRADSTAWATQVRLLLPQVSRRLAEEVGEGVVTKVVVLAPTAPSWRRGPRSAHGGQGPRDTYG